MPRPRRLPLLLAAVLGALAALLFAASDRPRAVEATSAPEFPRYVREAEQRRLEQRRTLPPVVAASTAAPGDEPPPRRDPFLVALPRDPKSGLVVLEANALRHSRIGELFVDCLFKDQRRDPFESLRQSLGIDPLKDVDRVALAEDGVVVTGFFEGARFEKFAGDADVVSYGGSGKIYRPRARAPAALTMGTWGGSIVLLGAPAFVEQAMDRLEGRVPPSQPVISESSTYGEAYGVLTGAALTELFHGEQAELGRRLAAVASRITLHADAMRDVAVSAYVTGGDAAGLDDLGSALGAALAVARLQARARGDDRLAQLLEHARVERGSPGFTVELAIPVNLLEAWFAGCGNAAGPARE